LWEYFELKNLLEEVHQIADAAENVGRPEKPFELHADPDFDDEENSQRFMKWIADEFLLFEPVYVAAFKVGLNGAPLFDEAFAGHIGGVAENEFAEFIRADVSSLSDAILFLARNAWIDETIDRRSIPVARRLFEDLRLNIETATNEDIHEAGLGLNNSKLADFVPLLFILGDLIVLQVFHELGPVAPKRVDWEWLRQGIREMRERGEKYPAVQILASGELSTGPLGTPALEAMAPIKDTENEVLFSDSSSGICVIVNTTWDELKAGKHFPVLNDELRDENAPNESR
jgi:hypothetical protein